MENENNTLPVGSLRKVKPELYQWRDEWISSRHREFGWDAPMLDLDFPALEYDQGKPVALVEYKHYNADVKLWHPSFKAMRYMADKCEIPFFIIIYYPDHHNYYIIPMNDFARQVPRCEGPKMWTERNYVKMLYWLRKKRCPESISEAMWNTALPEGAPKVRVDGTPL